MTLLPPLQNSPGRRCILLLSVACILSGTSTLGFGQSPSSTGRRTDEGDTRLNVLFIISDDLSAEALGCYGNLQCQTPAIDRLADCGQRLEHAYCQYPVCGPSRAALMSGMYPQSIGVMGNGQSSQLTENLGERVTLPQHFRHHGYFTARVSKIYHMRVPGDITAGVDGPDHAASWTERYNCQGPEWMSSGRKTHLSNERLRFAEDEHYGLGFGTAFYVVEGNTDGSEQPDYQAATRAIQLLQAHQDEPFFLAVGLVRPHVPLIAPAAEYGPYPAAEMQLPERVEDDWDDIPRLGITRNSAKIGVADDLTKQREILRAYYASVSFMDRQVGRILDELERLQLDERTIVVFTSDHGYHLGEHNFWQKMSLHEESARIPLIIAGPGIPAGTCSGLAQQIDLFPTLAELAGLPIPAHCQGTSLVPLLQNDADEVHEAVYCIKPNGHLLRTRRHALLQHRDGSLELYDMQVDPQQFENLANEPAQKEILQTLQRKLAEHLEDTAWQRGE